MNVATLCKTGIKHVSLAAALSLSAAAANAQTTFNPPLNAATPLSAPVYLEMQPGWRSDCVMTMTADDANFPPLPPTPMSFVVTAADAGVNVTMTDGMSGMEFAMYLGDDGTVTFDDAAFRDLGLTEAQLDAIREQTSNLVREAAFHRRTLAQDEVVFNAEDLSGIFGALLEGMPPGLSLELDGQSVVAGQSVANGRTVLVFKSDLDMFMSMSEGGQNLELSIAVSGYDAIDLETGLYVHSEYDMLMTFPPDPNIPFETLAMQMNQPCTLAPLG